MSFKYFIGVKDSNELKARYRSLANQYHPDRGGDVNVFMEMKAEYEAINKNAFITYPIQTTAKIKLFTWEEIIVRRSERFVQEELRRRAQKEELRRKAQRDVEVTFNKLRQDDPYYDAIDSLLEELKLDKNEDKFKRSLIELEDLNLNHFKYIKFVCGGNGSPLEAYVNYKKSVEATR